MPEFPTHEPHEKPARISSADNPSMFGSRYEFEPVAFGVIHQAEPHGFGLEREQPPGISEVSGNDVPKDRRIFSPLPV